MSASVEHVDRVAMLSSPEQCWEVRDDPTSGRGLFATRRLKSRTLLTIAPAIQVPKVQYDEHCKYTIFEEYLFNCPDGSKLLALGVGSLFNHSRHPNVDYRVSAATQSISYYIGLKDVEVGEELCIYYGPDDQLWFDYPPDPEVPTEQEDEEEDVSSNQEGNDSSGEHRIENLASLESTLSPEAYAALQSHLGSKTD